MKKVRIIFISAILAAAGYFGFTLLAYLRYPLHYSPLTNWLSDLGNPELNPHGAIFYNIGILSTALLLMVFFLGMSVWKIENKKVQGIMLRLSQAFGILGAFCMLLSGIFPINHYEIHSFLSTSLYIFLSTGFVFSAVAFRYHRKIPRWLLALGISIAPFVILTSIFQTVYLLEWIIVFLLLSYVILLGITTQHM
jgi:hypothetical membrane protein